MSGLSVTTVAGEGEHLDPNLVPVLRQAQLALDRGIRRDQESALRALYDVTNKSGSMFWMDNVVAFKSAEIQLLVASGKSADALTKSLDLIGVGEGRLMEVGLRGLAAAQKAALRAVGDDDLFSSRAATNQFLDGVRKTTDLGAKFSGETQRKLTLSLYQMLTDLPNSGEARSLARGVVMGTTFGDPLTKLSQSANTPEIGKAVQKLMTGNPDQAIEALHNIGVRLGAAAPWASISDLTLQALRTSSTDGLKTLRTLAADLQKYQPQNMELRSGPAVSMLLSYGSSLLPEERQQQRKLVAQAKGWTEQHASEIISEQQAKLEQDGWRAVGKGLGDMAQSAAMAFGTGYSTRNALSEAAKVQGGMPVGIPSLALGLPEFIERQTEVGGARSPAATPANKSSTSQSPSNALPKITVLQSSEMTAEVLDQVTRVAGIDRVAQDRVREAIIARSADPAPEPSPSSKAIGTLRAAFDAAKLGPRTRGIIENGVSRLFEIEGLHNLQPATRSALQEAMEVLAGRGRNGQPPGAGDYRLLTNKLNDIFQSVRQTNPADAAALSSAMQLSSELTRFVERPEYQPVIQVLSNVVAEHNVGLRERSAGGMQYIQKQLSNQLEIFLLANDPVDKGNYGLVFKVDPQRVEPQFRALLETLLPSSNPSAMKVLKVTSLDAAVREQGMQLEAKALIDRLAPELQKQTAQIPEIRILGENGAWSEGNWNTLTIRDPAVIEKLSAQGVAAPLSTVGADGKPQWQLSTIMMDWIPGENLARIIMNRANTIMGDPVFDEQYMQSSQGTKAHALLSKNDIGINPRIIQQMENALKTLNSGGIAHNDGHLRNWMVVGSPEAIFDRSGKQTVQVYLIDFGAAMKFSVDGGRARLAESDSYLHIGNLRKMNNQDFK